MKREFLTSLGLTDEAIINKIMAENGNDIEGVKLKYADYDTLKTQLSTANTKLEGYDPEWKKTVEAAQTTAQKQVDALKFDFVLDGALGTAKAKNVKAVKALLNMDGLKLNGEEIVGLKEQLDKIKTDNDYLFDSGEAKPAVKFVGTTPGATINSEDKKAQTNSAFRAAFGKE